jgi:hypothetical protein
MLLIDKHLLLYNTYYNKLNIFYLQTVSRQVERKDGCMNYHREVY